MKGLAPIVAVAVAAFMLAAGTASAAKPLGFYSGDLNGYNCSTGTDGTAGGAFGAARFRSTGLNSSWPTTIRLRGVAPNTEYNVVMRGSDCVAAENVVTIVTNDRGSASGTGSFFFEGLSFHFTAEPVGGGTEYATEWMPFF